MTVNTAAKAARVTGAASPERVDWHAIDWQKVHRTVDRLQMRIVKAMQEGRWGKVKALQRLLTHSFSGKALAVKRVTENKGKRTAGIESVRRGDFAGEPNPLALALGLRIGNRDSG